MNPRCEQFQVFHWGDDKGWTGEYWVIDKDGNDLNGQVEGPDAESAFTNAVCEANKIAQMIDRQLARQTA